MTPQEKAKELVEQFNCGGLETFAGHNVKVISKQCALIAVDEVIKQNNVWIRLVNKGTNNYWLEVKQEIEKL
jgi:hypothetical protein